MEGDWADCYDVFLLIDRTRTLYLRAIYAAKHQPPNTYAWGE